MKNAKLSELQKAAEWVRFARTNHALHGDSSSEAELVDAIKAFSEEQQKQDKSK